MTADQGAARPTPFVSLDQVVASGGVGDGVHWSLEAGTNLNVNLVHLDPGSSVAPHTNHDLDGVVIVITGTGRRRVDGSDHELGPHVLAHIAKLTERSMVGGAHGVHYLTVHHRRGPLGVTSKPVPGG